MTSIQREKNNITNIRLKKLDREHMLQVAASLHCAIDPALTDEEVSTFLWGFFQSNTPRGSLVECDICGGASSPNLDVCPFCGQEGDEDENETPIHSSSSESFHAPDGLSAEDVESVTSAVPSALTTKKTSSKKSTPAKKPPKEATMTTVAVAPAPHANGKAIQKHKEDDLVVSSEIRTERELDQAVREVHKLKSEAATSYWDLGVKVKEIYDNQLWKLRTEAGKPRYKSVDAFCHAELGMTPQHAYSLMDVAKHFTKAQVAAFGTSKLGLVLQAPAEDQARIMAELKKTGGKKSFREIEKEVRKTKVDKGGHRRESRGKKMPIPKKGKPKTQITIASILGSQTVKLYVKPTTKEESLALTKQDRATKIKDVPYGRMELENGVAMYFTVNEAPSGELVLRVETKREAAV